MKKYLVILFMIIFSAILSCQVVYAMTQQEADDYNNLYYPQSVYNGGINAAPQGTNQNGYVDPATGSTLIKVTDLTLLGVNGFDLNITRTYNSTNASLFEAYLKETDISYDAPYYMITGSKRVYRFYTDSNWDSTIYDNICLTPDFLTYLNTENAEWMVVNSTKYEYAYEENPARVKLFASLSDAQEVVSMINSTSNEIDASFPYSNTVDYEIDYYDFEVVTVWKTDYYTGYTDGLLDDTATERYSKLGVGWEFDFPYIETRYGYDDIYEYLHFGDKGTWLIDFYEGGANNLAGYPLNDIKLVSDSSITHDGMRSMYRVDEKDGTKHYFGTDGRLLIQQDRYGNQIKFYCNIERYINVWGEYESYPYIQKIVDTLGREVVFTFERDDSDNITMYMTITDPSDSTNVRQYSYYLDKLSNAEIGITSYDECAELLCNEWVLQTVVDPVGKVYRYNYDFLQTKFAFLDENSTFYYEYYDITNSAKGNSYIDDDNFEEFAGIHNTYALLRFASRTGEKSYYFKYAPFIKNCTPNGSMMFYKVYHTYEESVANYAGDSYFLNEKTYNYDINEVGEYDGYINYKRDDEIESTYDYAVKITDTNIGTGKTSYDIYKYTYLGANREKTILLTKLTDQGTDHKIITDYSYDTASKLITGISNKNYSVSDSTKYMTTSTAYTYDSGNYGDVLTETPNNSSDRVVTYTYDSTYHFMLTKIYKQDANTTVREEYVPTSNGKSIEYINVYVNDALKSKIRYSHDSYGNIVSEKKYLNNTDYIETEYTYQNGAYLIRETVKQVADNDNITSNVSVSSTYDYWGYPITQTDANGNTTAYTYDGIGRVLTITNPDSSVKQYSYYTKRTQETDELGNRINTYYTGGGEVESVNYSTLGVDYNYRYFTPYGQLETEVIYAEELEGTRQKEFNKTQYTYDTLQRPLTKEVYDNSGALVYKETYSYEVTADYRKETVTVVGGENNPSVVTSVYYDNYGNKIKTEIGSDYETYTSDYAGNIISVKSARANNEGWAETHQTAYDFMGNVVTETDEYGNTERAEYDQLGRLVKAYDKAGYATEYKYDNLGRVIELKTPFEVKNETVYYSTKQMWYDNNGNIVKERVYTNAAGEASKYNEVKYTYDNRNRLVMTESNDGTTSNYVQNYYDAKGNLLRVYTGLHSPLTINGLDDVTVGEDAEYAVAKYSYDSLGRLLTTTDALGNVESKTYDTANGLLLSTTDRNGSTFNFAYDGSGRIKSKSLSGGTNAETTVYGLTGQPLSKQNDTTIISYVYNDKGLILSETNSASGVVKNFAYDSAENVLTMTITRNGAVDMSQSYVYDKLNRLTSVSENGTVIATYTYDSKNNRTQTIVPGGETTSYNYNIANMLTGQITGGKLSETYSYYLNGNQRSKLSNGQTTNYTYDSMNRLIRENDTEYTFDDFGNRHTKIDGEITTTYSYDLNNRLTESVEENGDVTTSNKFFYDNNGNQITKATMVNQPYSEGMSGDYTISNISDNFVALYEYNCYNQLVGVDTDGIISSYAYSPDGLRHSKTVGGETTTFVYDAANVIEEITTDGTNKYYRGIEIIKNEDGLYYLYNGQGDVSILIDDSGTTIADYVFDAYGNQSQENELYNPFGYRGEYTDSESGLIYLRARMYDAETGRFINEDPIKGGVNWYSYCNNNPVLFVDPYGLEAQLDEYINSNYAGKKNITLVIKRPVANSRDAATIENGKLNNGHSFIRLDDGNGTVQYVGFGPESNSIANMILGSDVEGKFIDDSKTDWNVAKVYTLTDKQYTSISEYIDKMKKKDPNYNIETYNCTTFAVNTVKVGNAAAGNFMTVNEHSWTLPSDMEQQLANYKALPNWLSPGVAAWVINNTMGNFYGYTPADAAQDLKSAEGTVLLKYDGSVKTITNTYYFRSK